MEESRKFIIARYRAHASLLRWMH